MSKTTNTAVAVVEAATSAPRMAIPNIAALSDDALRAALRKNGRAPGLLGREKLSAMAKEAQLWDYKGDVVPGHYKKKYGKTQNCGDALAVLMVRPANMEQEHHLAFLADVADANGIKFERWAHCNYGQKVMNLGNVLRGMVKRGDYVIVGVTEFNAENA